MYSTQHTTHEERGTRSHWSQALQSVGRWRWRPPSNLLWVRTKDWGGGGAVVHYTALLGSAGTLKSSPYITNSHSQIASLSSSVGTDCHVQRAEVILSPLIACFVIWLVQSLNEERKDKSGKFVLLSSHSPLPRDLPSPGTSSRIRNIDPRELVISQVLCWLVHSILLLLLPDPGESLPPPPSPPPLPTPAWTHMQGSINRGPGLAVWQAGYCSRPGTGDWDTTLHLVLHYTIQ